MSRVDDEFLTLARDLMGGGSDPTEDEFLSLAREYAQEPPAREPRATPGPVFVPDDFEQRQKTTAAAVRGPTRRDFLAQGWQKQDQEAQRQARITQDEQIPYLQRAAASAQSALGESLTGLEKSYRDLAYRAPNDIQIGTPTPAPESAPVLPELVGQLAGGEVGRQAMTPAALARAGEVREATDPVTRFAADLVAMPATMLTPQGIAAMLISHTPSAGLMETLGVPMVTKVEQVLGPRVAAAVASELRASTGLAVFSGVETALRGGSAEDILGAAGHGAAAGLPFGLPGAIGWLRRWAPARVVEDTSGPQPSAVPELAKEPTRQPDPSEAPQPIDAKTEYAARVAQDALESLAAGKDPTPVPESRETLASQVDDLKDGKRRAVLYTDPNSAPQPPEGMESIRTSAGRFIFNPGRVKAAEIRQAVKDRRIGDILGDSEKGYGILDKPALQDMIGSVVVRTPEGVEKQAVVTDEPHLQSVTDAARAVAEPGDTIRLEDPRLVIADRLEAGAKTQEEARALAEQLKIGEVVKEKPRENQRASRGGRKGVDVGRAATTSVDPRGGRDIPADSRPEGGTSVDQVPVRAPEPRPAEPAPAREEPTNGKVQEEGQGRQEGLLSTDAGSTSPGASITPAPTETGAGVSSVKPEPPKKPAPFSRSDLESRIIREHQNSPRAQAEAMQDDMDIAQSGQRNAGDMGGFFDFRQDTIPADLESALDGRPDLRKMIKTGVRDREAIGSDQLATLGAERWAQIAERKLRVSNERAVSEAKAALMRDAEQNPQGAFLAQLHDNLPSGRAKAKTPTDPADIRTGAKFTIDGHEFRVIEDASGMRVLKDGKEFDPVPVDALDTVPIDKGSVGDATMVRKGAGKPAEASAPEKAPEAPPKAEAPTDPLYDPELEAPKPAKKPSTRQKVAAKIEAAGKSLQEKALERLKQTGNRPGSRNAGGTSIFEDVVSAAMFAAGKFIEVGGRALNSRWKLSDIAESTTRLHAPHLMEHIKDITRIAQNLIDESHPHGKFSEAAADKAIANFERVYRTATRKSVKELTDDIEAIRKEVAASKADAAAKTDFTERKVTDEPTPEEPEGPVTSARNAMTERDRKGMGLEGYDSPERRTWQAALDTAVAQGLPEKALRDAAILAEHPRPLNDIETAGLIYRAAELKNEHEKLLREMKDLTSETDIDYKAAELDAVQKEFDLLTTAINNVGTEQGRALASRKLTLDRDYSLIAMKSRFKQAKRANITPDESFRIETLNKRMDELNANLERVNKRLEQQTAERTIIRESGRKRTSEKAREAEFKSLVSRARELLAKGCD